MECDIVQPHISAYDVFVDRINDVAAAAHPERFRLENGQAVELSLRNAHIGTPSLVATATAGACARGVHTNGHEFSVTPRWCYGDFTHDRRR